MSTLADLLRACPGELEIRSLEPLGEGDFCRAWLLNGHRVVRIPRHEEAVRALAMEASLLPELASRLPVEVPVPECVSCPSPAGNVALSLHELVPGRELTPELWRALPEAERTGLARELGRFLRRLHAVDPGLGRRHGVGVVDHAVRARQLRRRLRGEAGSPIPGTLRRQLDVWLRRYVDDGPAWSYEPALLHADLSPGHVLVDPARREITGIIDWGDAVVGDPARDLIFLYEDWGSEFLALAVEGYAPARPRCFLARVYLLYLVDQLDWTLGAAAAAGAADLEHGIAALRQGVRDLEGDGPGE